MPFVFSPKQREREREILSVHLHTDGENFPLLRCNDCPPSAVLLCTELRRYEEFLRDSCSPLFLYFSFLCVPLPRNNPELQQLHISTCHAGLPAKRGSGGRPRLWLQPRLNAEMGSASHAPQTVKRQKIHLPLSCFGGNYLKCFSDIPGSLASYKITLRF